MAHRKVSVLLAVLGVALASVPSSADVCVGEECGEPSQICVDAVRGACLPDIAHGPDPCEIPIDDQEHPLRAPKCLPGPASCVAIGLAVEAEPNAALPTGAYSHIAKSQTWAQSQAYTYAFANAYAVAYGGGFSWWAYAQAYAEAQAFAAADGYAHADAHVAHAGAPGTAEVHGVESSCDAGSGSFSGAGAVAIAYCEANPNFRFCYNDGGSGSGSQQFNGAFGHADVEHVELDLMPNYSVPLSLSMDVLCEAGFSANGTGAVAGFGPCIASGASAPASLTGGNTADIANLVINGTPVLSADAAPNTHIPLPPPGPGLVADLYLNEQGVSGPFFCPTYWGDALRVVVSDAASGATVATVTVSHVATTSCGFFPA